MSLPPSSGNRDPNLVATMIQFGPFSSGTCEKMGSHKVHRSSRHAEQCSLPSGKRTCQWMEIPPRLLPHSESNIFIHPACSNPSLCLEKSEPRNKELSNSMKWDYLFNFA